MKEVKIVSGIVTERKTYNTNTQYITTQYDAAHILYAVYCVLDNCIMGLHSTYCVIVCSAQQRQELDKALSEAVKARTLSDEQVLSPVIRDFACFSIVYIIERLKKLIFLCYYCLFPLFYHGKFLGLTKLKPLTVTSPPPG